MPSLALVQYSSWNDTDGKDETTGFDETTTYDDSLDASGFWDNWIATHFQAYQPLTGSRVSPVIDLSPAKIAKSSEISWTTTLPANTTLTIETNLSLDGGTTWQGWQICGNRSVIPGIGAGTDLSTAQLKIRQKLTTTDPLVTPQLQSLTVTITSEAEIQIFDGYVDEVALRSTPGETSCNVACRDKAKKLKLARWTDDKTYEDTTATETANILTSVTASTNLAAGGQIQSQAAVYSRKLYATVLGIEKEVTPSSESGDIIAGTYQADYSETGLTNLRLVAYLDLKIAENLQSVAATTNGTATVDISSDGQAWSAFATGTARYLRITVNKSTGPVTLGVTVTTATNYVPGNVLVDDSMSWRPTTADLDRTITGDAGSSQTANVLTAKLGVNELDPNARYKVKVEQSADGASWTEITTVASAGRSLEVVFAPVAARYWRLTFLGKKDAPPAVRYLAVKNVTVDAAKKVYLSDIIQDIAASEGETLFRITPTRTYVKAVTFERGTDKWESIQKLAQEHGWEAFYDRDGYLVARPVDVDPWKDLPIYKSNLSFDATFSDAEIYNQILTENGDPKTPLTSTKTNDNAWSATSTVNLGNRASPVVKAPLADTQAKLDAFALAELEKASRQTHSARLTHIADGKYPAANLEAGDVIQAEDAQSGISDTYVLESFRLEDRPDSAEYDFAAEVSEL